MKTLLPFLIACCTLLGILPQHLTAAKPEQSLFGVQHTGKDYFFLIPDSLVGRRFLVTVRFTSAPANTGKYGGEMVNQQTVYFEKVEDRLLMRSELLLNVADTLSAINRAVEISNSNPIIASFKVESRSGGRLKVKVSDFFNEDNAAIGLSQGLKRQFGLANMLPAMSYIESIKSFPLNTEVRTVKTWASAAQPTTAAGRSTGKVTIGLNVSFVLLPKTPMRRRWFDPRVGYFTDSFTYYSDYQQRVEPRRFITRWRLEPKDSADAERMARGELVEPKKPIVYYIDPATPKQWRPYLIQGVNDWQKAFEAAGFKNAIMAKEWPDDKTMSLEDARYSVIRYLASPIENAYGPQVHDPCSGEILESHICWYHNVMTLVHDWYMIQAGNIDEAARQMKYGEELMGQLIRFVSSHEVGHTLGLRHNFGSSSTVPVDSLRSKSFTETHGHTPSIMDYARFNYVAQPEDSIGHDGIFPRIGDYDVWAIRWGYTPMPKAFDDVSDHYEIEKLFTPEVQTNRRLWFGDGETNQTRDGRCQTEDLGDDAIKASHYGILNLQRMLPQLSEWTYQKNDIYNRNLSGVYQQVINQFMRYIGHVRGNIAAVYHDYRTIDDGGSVYQEVSRERQRECLAFIEQQVFQEPTWLVEPSYVRTLTPNYQDVTIRVGEQVLRSLLTRNILGNMNSQYKAPEYLNDLCDKIFSELSSGNTPSPFRQALQRTFVASLTDYFKNCSATDKERPAVLGTLRKLQKMLETTTGDDAENGYASHADIIERTLVVK